MKTRLTKPYVQPAMDVVWLELRVPLLTDSPISTGGNIDPWQSGEGGSGEINM